MTEAHHRKKAPQQVRRALLDCAAQMAVQNGLAGVSLRSVAAAAGVTKGGLLHHFPDRQTLIAAVCADLLQSLDRLIDQYLDDGGRNRYGAFTRAYVLASLSPDAPHPWTSLSMALLTDQGLRILWSAWVEKRLLRHRDTDSDPALAVVRYAADGIWLTGLLQKDQGVPPEQEILQTRLLAQLLAMIDAKV